MWFIEFKVIKPAFESGSGGWVGLGLSKHKWAQLELNIFSFKKEKKSMIFSYL